LDYASYLVVSLLVQLDGGEAVDLGMFQFIDGSINLSNDNGVIFGKLLSQLKKRIKK